MLQNTCLFRHGQKPPSRGTRASRPEGKLMLSTATLSSVSTTNISSLLPRVPAYRSLTKLHLNKPRGPNVHLGSPISRKLSTGFITTPLKTTAFKSSSCYISTISKPFSTYSANKMPIVTPLNKLLGIEVPIVQGGMQWVGVPKLAAAVSEAGGLGILTALTQPSPDALRIAIRETRKLTSKPFGVNITLLPSINPPDYEGYARAAVEEGVRVFETAGNNPGPLIKYFKSQGCVVLHKCTTIRHAKSAERLGVDVLSIDGFECAGHPGEDDIGGLVLMARAIKELKVPFIASGGIADGRGFAAALALGAVGVNMGTRFMCTVESPIHQNIKDKIVASTERDTVHIFRTLHNTARVFKNKVSMEVVAIEKRGNAKFEDVKDLVSGARGRIVYEKGDPDYGIWSAGIAVGLIDDVPTCEVLLRRFEREVQEIVGSLNKFVVGADGGAACPVSGVKAKL